ncbi:MAG: hypothetical protein COT43_02700 [Candidatus Marinimicrobia bacterium CG08_land_8_20_14_0_20_45_22]|nr:MAG: hypothetical protein COT43_02700 [Candidatus Marinimicrobia bacterium CG08_land_8_20_14_0_20_45_22]
MKMTEDIGKNMLRPNEIIGKRSVRTTFKISEITEDSLKTIFKRDKLKPKEFFDIICSSSKASEVILGYIKKSISNGSDIYGVLNKRKTLVISKNSLHFFNQKSSELKVTRDVLFNICVISYKLLMDDILDKEKEKEQKACEIVTDFWGEAEEIEKQLTELLGEDNPVTQRFSLILIHIMNLYTAIDTKLKTGEPIDPD